MLRVIQYSAAAIDCQGHLESIEYQFAFATARRAATEKLPRAQPLPMPKPDLGQRNTSSLISRRAVSRTMRGVGLLPYKEELEMMV